MFVASRDPPGVVDDERYRDFVNNFLGVSWPGRDTAAGKQ
jgi:hypothetical protein